MYPSFIEDADGEEIEYPISIVKEQSGETVHFLDMEMVQSKVNLVSQIRTYDKRDHMAMLRVAEYDHRPQIPQKCRNQIATVDKYSICYKSLPTSSVCNKMCGDPIILLRSTSK